MVAPGLTKQRIVAAGLAVLDAKGLNALTVRAVAAELDVQAPALYWHVRDKQDLLDEMAAEMWRAIVAVMSALPDDTPWQRGMTIFATETRRILLSHREGAKVFSGTNLRDIAILAKQEASLARMVADDFTLKNALTVSSLIYYFTLGFCIEEQSVSQAIEAGYSFEERSSRLDQAKTPLIVASGADLFADQDARFAAMLAMLIDAGERLRFA